MAGSVPFPDILSSDNALELLMLCETWVIHTLRPPNRCPSLGEGLLLALVDGFGLVAPTPCCRGRLAVS